ncbi:hypothetical protein [Nonlabens sp. Asnod3-A02]|uniref:hypothetical protein n=1 Tax=Nonlabens sp. Asnod3-A02 TaxID=3160579 RepID=UPI0038699FA1
MIITKKYFYLITFILITSCSSKKSYQFDANSISNQIREDYECSLESKSYTKYMNFGDDYFFWIDLFIDQVNPEFKKSSTAPEDLFDFEFIKHKEFYEMQSQKLKKNSYSGTICGIEVIDYNSVLLKYPSIKEDEERRDSIIKSNGEIRSDASSIKNVYKYYQALINQGKVMGDKIERLSLVPQYLIRYDGLKALRVTRDPRGAVLHIFIKQNEEWIQESETPLKFIKF